MDPAVEGGTIPCTSSCFHSVADQARRLRCMLSKLRLELTTRHKRDIAILTETRNDLEICLKETNDCILQTNRLLNAQQTVNRLPPELLARIFDFVQELATEDLHRNLRNATVNSAFGWLRIYTVCRYWWHTYLSFPGLSSVLTWLSGTPGRESILDQLRRSGDTPFTLHISGYKTPRKTENEAYPVETFWTDVALHCHRILECHISSPTPCITYLPIDSTTPRLQKLTIITSSRGSHIPIIFGCRMPALKYLTLERVNNWLPGTFSGLVHFNLTADFDDSYVLNSLLDVLRNSPDLQELLICHRSNGLPDDQDVESVENPIYMGKLSVLIGSKMTRYQAYRLLSWLRIPSSATIAMFNMVTLPERVPLSVLPTDPANLPSLQRPQKLWIWKSSHLMTTDADYRPLLFMSLKEECKKTWSQDNNIFNYFDCDLPLAALINELRLVGDVPLDAGTSYWTETLRAMPTLELIDLKLPLEDIRTILSLFSVLSCPEGSLRCSPIHIGMVKSLEDGIRAEADNPSSSHPLVQLSFRVKLGEHPAYMCVKVNQAESTLNSTAPFIRTIVKRYRATEVMESSYTIEVPELWRAHWQGDWPAVSFAQGRSSMNNNEI